MSESFPAGTATEGALDAGAACGARLREARAAAGLSIDAVAQQLKLHPRQVQALEEGRFDQLPGRTFVRGFLRNYARALHLDAEELLAMLPEPAPQTIAPTAHSMGEIRFEHAPRRSWSRWAIPLVLVALVALAAVYEFLRPGGADAPRTTSPPPARMQPQSESAPPAPAPTQTLTPTPTPGGTPLPNPLTTGSNEPARQADAPMTAGDASAPPAAAPAASSSGIVSTAIPPAAPGEPTLIIVYGGKSWTEVRDASGKVLLSLTGSPGMTQSVTGTPPFDVVIGSVADVSMRFRGAPVNLDPYRRANVARLRLD